MNNASLVHGKGPGLLFQGGVPDEGISLARSGISLLVLAAREHQPPATAFPGVEHVVRCPLRDVWDPDETELGAAIECADIVRRALRQRKRVLVTCYMGWNRSGLVSGLALVRGGMPPVRAIALIRAARGPNALSNPAFARAISLSSHTPLR